METITDNILITLNSKYGIKQNDTYLSDVIFSFRNILKPNDNVKRSFISLQNATIPVSFYIINSLNNRLVLKDVGGGGTHNIDIDYGNYSANTLIIELQSKINAGYPHSCTITFNKNNGKFTFTFTGDTQIRNTTTMSDVLGTGGGNLSSDSSYIIIMPYPVNLLGVKKLLIKSQILDINSFDSQTGNKLNILATIPVSDPFYNLITYIPATETKYLLTIDLINNIDIQITDEENNLINFNNLNWTLTFCLTIEKYISVSLSSDFMPFVNNEEPPQEQPESISFYDMPEELPVEQPEDIQEIQNLKHTIKEPETLSESLKQFSESLLKGVNNYTHQAIRTIKRYGDNIITKMTLKRSPVRKMIIKTLNVLSLGKWEKADPYDTLWHIYINLTLDTGDVIRLEKNSVLSIKVNAKDDPMTETMEVKYPTNFLLTLNTLLENTRKRMGKKYFLYDAKSANCQHFLKSVFLANNLGTPEEMDFILQNTRDIFNKNPEYLRQIALYTTSLRAKAEMTRSEVLDLWKHKTDLQFLTS